MVNLQKVVVEWTGFQGAPGYNVFYRGDANVITSNLRTFYDSVKGLLPAGVSVTVPNAGDLVDSATGELSGAWTTAINLTVTGTSAAVYAAPCGAICKWFTASIVNGRRLRGKTFLVPLTSAAYQSDGSILTTALTTLKTAADALVTAEAANLGVWHRPVAGAGGSWSPTTAATVPDRVSILRSRRD